MPPNKPLKLTAAGFRLKFELAAYVEEQGATEVEVETSSRNLDACGRADVSFSHGGLRTDVELKTANTNWQLPGVRKASRPITQNIADIVADARKLARNSKRGVIAFVLFPIPVGDERWHPYLARIAEELGIHLSPDEHGRQITVKLNGNHSADLAVVSFPVENVAASTGTRVEQQLGLGRGTPNIRLTWRGSGRR